MHRRCSITTGVVTCLSLSFACHARAQYIVQTRGETGHIYILTPEMTWEEAEALAVSWGQHLVAINDADENQWLTHAFLPEPPVVDAYGPSCGGAVRFTYHIGLNDLAENGVYSWSNGEPVTYANWEFSQPSQPALKDFGRLDMLGRWEVGPGTALLQGIIEADPATLPDSNGDGKPDILYTEEGSEGPPSLLAAWSRRYQGAGLSPCEYLSLPLPLGGTPEIEPRGFAYGQDSLEIVLDFDEPVYSADGGLDCDNVMVTAGACLSVTSWSSRWRVRMTPPPTGSCLTLTVLGAEDDDGLGLVGDVDVQLRMLEGDATGDGVVNIEDLSLIKQKIFADAVPSTLRANIHSDAKILIPDLQYAKNQLFLQVDACPE